MIWGDGLPNSQWREKLQKGQKVSFGSQAISRIQIEANVARTAFATFHSEGYLHITFLYYIGLSGGSDRLRLSTE